MRQNPTLVNTEKMEQCFSQKSGANFFPSNCIFSGNIEPIISVQELFYINYVNLFCKNYYI